MNVKKKTQLFPLTIPTPYTTKQKSTLTDPQIMSEMSELPSLPQPLPNDSHPQIKR